MSAQIRNIIVIGQGVAGLAAALAAAEHARALNLGVAITLLEKAPEGEAGGNTRWSPSYMRMASPDRVEPSFVDDMLKATGGRGDRAYFERLATEAPATVGWIASHGVEFHQPVYYLAKGPPRIQPVGGGPAVIQALTRAAKAAGVMFRYDCAAQTLRADGGKISGIDVESESLAADAVILASGGFQGSAAMMSEHLGPPAKSMKLISPGTRFNTGDGIKMAQTRGAHISGDWRGMHCEPVDPRSMNSAPVVLVYPYGIVVDRNGDRFFDEGAGLVHETWEAFARQIQFEAPGAVAYAILDSRLLQIADYQRAIRSEVPPFQADTIQALAKAIDIPPDALAATVARYNEAAPGDSAKFDATRCDGLAAGGDLDPPKSNWARALDKPPYLAWPLIGAVAYTFGGLATNENAEVLGNGGAIPGLYAAGEITGHFHGTAPNAVSVLRAFVFGRIAGRQAISFLAAAAPAY